MHCCCCVNVGGAQVETNEDVSVWADVVLGRVGGAQSFRDGLQCLPERSLSEEGKLGLGVPEVQGRTDTKITDPPCPLES